jgi:hypothetical protein
MAKVISIDEATRRFIACAECVGYCRDSGRTELAEDIQEDLHGLFTLFGSSDSERIERLLGLLRDEPSPWVKYHAAMLLIKFRQDDAIKVLENLEQDDRGAYGYMAQVAPWQARASRH